jgi:hypothetical protein
MDERFAVAFRDGTRQATGALVVEAGRLRLQGRSAGASLELEIPYSELAEVRVGRLAGERLNGYPTLVLERTSLPPVRVAPFGFGLVREIGELLFSLTQPAQAETLAVQVPLKPGCLGRARKLLAKGPPLDPASLGLSGHEVYLREGQAVFLFRGANVRAQVGQAMRQPAVWRAGLAWQRCLAGPPSILETTGRSLDAAPAYRWPPPELQPRP